MESVGIPNMKRERVLVIEDESDILELLRFNLKKEGYDVEYRYRR
jgi:DNA-binding response OmpR family regulator